MTSAEKAPRVAVIGGGIIGLAIAWRLAAGGARVELFERGELAGEATHVAAGMLAPVSEADPAEPELLSLGLESARAWPAFAAELEAALALIDGAGEDLPIGSARVATPSRRAAAALGDPASTAALRLPLIRTDGTLLVARDADEGRWLERESALRAAQGLTCERLTPTQARRLEPDLAPGLRGALHVPGDHSVDPRQIAQALAAAARAAGAALHDHTPIDGLADARLADFDRVVVCSGAWPLHTRPVEPPALEGSTLPGDRNGGSEASSPSGATDAAGSTLVNPRSGGSKASSPTDTHPVKGQLLVLRDPDHGTRDEPIVRRTLRAQTIYLVPRGDGRYIAGATMEHRGYDRTVTAWAVHDLLRELFEVVPATREFVLEETVAGLRPATTSGDPLIGPAPGDPDGPAARVLYAIGHYRNGVLLTPATAHRIAALVLP